MASPNLALEDNPAADSESVDTGSDERAMGRLVCSSDSVDKAPSAGLLVSATRDAAAEAAVPF